jgi:hypothetical protein
MMRILVGGLALALCVPLAPAESRAAGVRSLPMQFEWRQEGPGEVCGTQCRTWVSAVGTITSETSHEFVEFARQHDLRGAMLVLDSGGGSVHGAIALGRQIRRLGMTTMVGKTIRLADRPGPDKSRAKLSPRADCESMCVFALLAGTKRIVPLGARLMVHQIWLGDRRDDAAAATYSAEDLVLVQRDIGRLAQYTVEMGGSIDFLELSLRIPPWEPMRALARDEIRHMRVETGPDSTTPPAMAVAATAASSQAVGHAARRGAEAAARGWVVVERAGAPMLVRSHPLTVEGEEIGSFDLTLACGETPGSLDVGYSERRMGVGGTAAPLKTVALALGARSEPLPVVSSEPMARSLEMSTQARGSVPASFIVSFSELSSRALVVSTVNANDTRTAIRVGNSGIAPAFALLQQSCGLRPLHATNARTGQSASGR